MEQTVGINSPHVANTWQTLRQNVITVDFLIMGFRQIIISGSVDKASEEMYNN